jgi:Zn-dependent peptidase ImmA (M78 family)
LSVLALDRMEIEEAGPNPERLGAAIHRQLGMKRGAVAVEAIAEALDIVEIRLEPMRGLEGALIMTDDRNVGSIVVNGHSNPRRRRFTLAHELGHFLNPWHRPSDPSGGFSCTRGDLGSGWQKRSGPASQHIAQEIEANCFAIELLAPPWLLRPYLRGIPDLAKVVALADGIGLSREAGARRYVELHPQPTALVFSIDGAVRYVERHSDFPFVGCQRGQRMLALPTPTDDTGLSAHVEADSRDWLGRPDRDPLVVQTLSQRQGYAITLLAFDATESEDDQTDA